MPRHGSTPSEVDDQVFVALLRIFLRVGEGLGFDRETLVERAGLGDYDLRDPDIYVPQACFRALGAVLLERSTVAQIGIAAATVADLSTLGLFGYVLRHSATLDAALTQVIRYANIVADSESWSRSVEPATGRVQIGVRLRPAEEALGFPAVAQLASCLTLSRASTGADIRVLAVSLRAPLEHERETLEDYFGCPVVLGAAQNLIELPSEVLALPILGARPELQPLLQDALLGMSRTKTPAQGIDGQLREMLLDKLAAGMTTRDEAAKALGMSARTLSRRLQEQGVSFRELLDEVRHELALGLLTDADRSIHEVAFLLGYSEPSTFFRCFRRWTGETPEVWRRQQAG